MAVVSTPINSFGVIGVAAQDGKFGANFKVITSGVTSVGQGSIYSWNEILCHEHSQ